MAKAAAHPPGVEPLAQLVRSCMDQHGLRVADVAHVTGLSRQLVSQIINRREHYRRSPKVDTLQALAKVPGLSIQAIAAAVADSTGMPRPPADDLQDISPLRKSVLAVVGKLPEDELPRAMQILVTLLG